MPHQTLISLRTYGTTEARLAQFLKFDRTFKMLDAKNTPRSQVSESLVSNYLEMTWYHTALFTRNIEKFEVSVKGKVMEFFFFLLHDFIHHFHLFNIKLD